MGNAKNATVAAPSPPRPVPAAPRARTSPPGRTPHPFYRAALWTINPDGTGEALLWHAEDHAFARVTERPDGRILFTRVEPVGAGQAGHDLRNP